MQPDSATQTPRAARIRMDARRNEVVFDGFMVAISFTVIEMKVSTLNATHPLRFIV
jgi:hypothetical protein